ncbi:MAG: O-antigen ligase family protein [Solirubrobacteraceae bacterium]
MIPFAALSGPLPKLGVIVVALLAAGTLLIADARRRAIAMLGALLLAPALLLVDIWHSPQLSIVHRHPLQAAVGAAVALVALAGAALLIARRPRLLGPLVMVALPFRIPISAGGNTSNLLVPLYFVVAAASVAWIVTALRDGAAGAAQDGAGAAQDGAGAAQDGAGAAQDGAMPRARPSLGWLGRLLAAALVLYAIQSVYSPTIAASSGFEKALQQMVFFYVPFALLLALLWELEWDRSLITTCLTVTVALAVIFACIGFVEYATKTLLLNPKLIAANEVHTYFTVNSVFFDPDIFGRYLALVMIMLAAVLLYDARPRMQLAVTALLAVLWAGLVLTLSRSSLAALLLGLGTLLALRWKARPVLAAGAVVIVLGGAAAAIAPKTFGLNQGLNGASSGRANLVSGGIDLFAQRPLWGYGSGSFVVEYRKHNQGTPTPLAASHTIPITIAAEQGLIGEILYLALVIVAAVTLMRGARANPPRAALAAAFLALMLHTMLYADFLEDPLTWTILGIGGAMAAAERARALSEPASERARRRLEARARA